MKNISYKTKKRITNIINYVFLTIVSLISIFPFYWMIVSATNNRKDIITGKLTFGSELINNLNMLLDMTNIFQAFINTTKITTNRINHIYFFNSLFLLLHAHGRQGV